MTKRVKIVDVTMPPIIGAAILFITSAPVPVVHMIGSNLPLIAATVIILRPHQLDRAFHHGFAKGYPRHRRMKGWRVLWRQSPSA